MSLYEGMLDLYRDMLEYNMIDVLDQSQMVGYGVEDDAAMDFDELNPSEFKECLDFIMTHYREAHNNNNKSGSHQPFADYTSGKPYLLYLHLWSAEIGAYQNLDTFERYCFLKNTMSYCSLFYCEEHDESSLIIIVMYVMIRSEIEKMHILFCVAKNGKKMRENVCTTWCM